MARVFNPDRYGFVVFDEDTIVVMRREDREMTTSEWANRILGIDQGDLPYMVRGYFTPDRIQFFSDNYMTSPDVNFALINAAFNTYRELYGADYNEALNVPVFNGVHQGAPGETWPPYLMFSMDTGKWLVVPYGNDEG